MTRILFVILIFLTSLFGGFWLTIPLSILYAMRWFALDLLFLGAAVDVYFGTSGAWPVYTLGAFLVVMVAEFGKRHVMLK